MINVLPANRADLIARFSEPMAAVYQVYMSRPNAVFDEAVGQLEADESYLGLCVDILNDDMRAFLLKKSFPESDMSPGALRQVPYVGIYVRYTGFVDLTCRVEDVQGLLKRMRKEKEMMRAFYSKS